MAEGLAVVGAVASIVQLVDFTTKVFERVNHYIRRVDEAPETLRDIGIHLPLLTTINPSIFRSISADLAVIANLLHYGADTSIHDDCRCPCAPGGCPALRRLLRPHGLFIGYIWIMECLLMLIDIQGRKIAQKALFEIERVHEFEKADMTHVCCNRKFSRADEPMDNAEIDEIIEEEKEFVAILDEKMRDISSSADNRSIEESWLSLISDFRTSDKPFKPEKYWTSWEWDGRQRVTLTSDTFVSRGTRRLGITRADEEKDKYWTLSEARAGHAVPPSSIYSAWAVIKIQTNTIIHLQWTGIGMKKGNIGPLDRLRFLKRYYD
jgi:hypothetical protein